MVQITVQVTVRIVRGSLCGRPTLWSSNDTYVTDGQQATIEEQEHTQSQKSDSKRDETNAHLYDES